jgi:pyruvate kinase
VLNTKKLGEQRPVHLPGVRLAAPLLAEHDLAGLRFAASNKVDIVTAPFVRGPQDVQLVRKMLDDFGGENVQVGAQICTAAARHACVALVTKGPMCCSAAVLLSAACSSDAAVDPV